MIPPRLLISIVAAAALIGVVALAETIPSTSSGYVARIANSTNAGATAQYFNCTAAEAADRGANSIFQWYLNEASGSSTAADSGSTSGTNSGQYRGSMTTSTTAPLACSRDSGGAYVLDGSTSYLPMSATVTAFTNPTTFSLEIWFKTSVVGGRLIGFGSSRTGTSSQSDRHLYIDTAGKLVFGTNGSGLQVVTSTTAVNDGKWHHAVGTMSAATGMNLYLDGAIAASNAAYTTPEVTTGFWRVGYDSLSGWPNAAANYYFTGQLRYAGVYSVVLTPTQVQNHWVAGQ